MSWSAETLSTLATGYWPAAALIAAVELRVFDALDAGPAGLAVLAERTASDAARLESLLDALAAIGLLDKAETHYALPPALRPLLARSSPTCMLDALAYNADLYRHWADLASVVRGGPTGGGSSQLGGDPAATRRFVLGMDAKARAFSPAVAERIDLAGVSTLLDIGSGPGTLSRRLAERSPGLHVTLLDLPPVLAVAREICAASTCAGRLTFHPADYRRDPLPAPFDAVLYAGALHQESPESAAILFEKVRATLRPGGRFFVIDLMLDDTRTSPPFSALFQVNMMLLRPGARVFSASDIRTAMDAVFIEPRRVLPIAGTPYVLVEGAVR